MHTSQVSQCNNTLNVTSSAEPNSYNTSNNINPLPAYLYEGQSSMADLEKILRDGTHQNCHGQVSSIGRSSYESDLQNAENAHSELQII